MGRAPQAKGRKEGCVVSLLLEREGGGVCCIVVLRVACLRGLGGWAEGWEREEEIAS